MKNIALHIILFSVVACAILLSCRKEYSYKGGIGNNKPPIANAGRDTIITLPIDSLILDGSKSFDPDGTITLYRWSLIANPLMVILNNPQTVNPVLKNLISGI